jgi:hypothetical protein
MGKAKPAFNGEAQFGACIFNKLRARSRRDQEGGICTSVIGVSYGQRSEDPGRPVASFSLASGLAGGFLPAFHIPVRAGNESVQAPILDMTDGEITDRNRNPTSPHSPRRGRFRWL